MKKILLLTMFLCMLSVVLLQNAKAMSLQDVIQSKWIKANAESQNNFSSANGMYIKAYVFYDDSSDPSLVYGPQQFNFLNENQVYDILVNQLNWILIQQFPYLDFYYFPGSSNSTDLLLLIYYKNGLAHQAIMLNGRLP